MRNLVSFLAPMQRYGKMHTISKSYHRGASKSSLKANA